MARSRNENRVLRSTDENVCVHVSGIDHTAASSSRLSGRATVFVNEERRNSRRTRTHRREREKELREAAGRWSECPSRDIRADAPNSSQFQWCDTLSKQHCSLTVESLMQSVWKRRCSPVHQFDTFVILRDELQLLTSQCSFWPYISRGIRYVIDIYSFWGWEGHFVCNTTQHNIYVCGRCRITGECHQRVNVILSRQHWRIPDDFDWSRCVTDRCDLIVHYPPTKNYSFCCLPYFLRSDQGYVETFEREIASISVPHESSVLTWTE